MPRITQYWGLSLRNELKAFLKLEAGVGRSGPQSEEVILKESFQKIRNLQQRLRENSSETANGAQRQVEDLQLQLQEAQSMLKEKLQAEQRAVNELHRERARWQASSGSVDSSSEPTTAALRNSHALPAADTSIKRFRIFRSLISRLKPGKMLDLGAGQGTFSVLAAELGWKVDAVDARTVRFPNPEDQDNSQKAEAIRSVSWIEADIRDFAIEEGGYDLVCIIGLFHHLELEDQIALLKRASGAMTILAARVAPQVEVTEGEYEGLYHHEPGTTREERDAVAVASWGNEASFIPTEESLIKMCRDCGFTSVLPTRPPPFPNYTFYLCLP